MTRQDGSGSPQRSHSGAVSGRIELQQPAQTGPAVGWSSSEPHAAQDGATRTDSTASVPSSNLEFQIPNGLPAPESGHLNTFGVAPQPFEAVKRARFAREDVDDEVEVVEQDPLGAVVAFDV